MPNLLRWTPLLVLALALAACEGCTATPPHSATVTWNASTTPVSGYHVYRTTDPSVPPEMVAVTPAQVTQYVDQAVEPGGTYYYSVKSVGLDGTESDFSENISATIPEN